MQEASKKTSNCAMSKELSGRMKQNYETKHSKWVKVRRYKQYGRKQVLVRVLRK